MGRDSVYTGGVIAVREKRFLGDRLLRMCGGTAEEAFAALSESGYGCGAPASSARDYEALVEAEERAVCDFIREYAPSEAEEGYFLYPFDFHNAKALFKASLLHADAEKLLAPEGKIPLSELSAALSEKSYPAAWKELKEALESANAYVADGGGAGAAIGTIFERALYKCLQRVVSGSGTLKKLLAGRADRANILTAVRASSEEEAKGQYLPGGALSEKQLSGLFAADAERAAHALDGTPCAAFAEKCVRAKAEGKPLTDAEREAASFETQFFALKKYELKKNQPFLYYVLRRRAENANVRVVFACLLAGMGEGEIAKRLRAMQ